MRMRNDVEGTRRDNGGDGGGTGSGDGTIDVVASPFARSAATTTPWMRRESTERPVR